MAYSLSLNGGAIQIPKITFTGDFSVTLKATQQANGRFFCGGDNTSGSIEIYRNNSGIVSLYIGTVGQFSGTTVLSTNVNSPDTIVVARSGSSVTVRVNGTLQGTATFSGNMHISWLGLRQGWGNYPATMRLYFCDMQDLATPSNSRYYDPSLSGGTGNVLPTTAGTNAGTQFGGFPTDNSEWVFYESAGNISASVSVSMPQMAVAVSSSKTAPAFSATIAATMPQMSVATIASATAPVFASTVGVTMPQMSVASSGSVVVGGVSSAISLTMPQMQAAVSASKSAPSFGASIAFAMPQMSVTATASKSTPGYPAAISVSMPQMTATATASNYVEGISAAVTFTMPQMRVTAYTDGVIFYAASTAHIDLPFKSRSITQLARSAALYAVARSSHINQIAKSRHIAYNYQSTHIEKRSA